MLEPGLYRTSDAETYRLRVSLSAGLLCVTLSAVIFTLERVVDRVMLFSVLQSGRGIPTVQGILQRIGTELNPLENPFFWIFAALGLFFLGIYFFTPIHTLQEIGRVDIKPDQDDSSR